MAQAGRLRISVINKYEPSQMAYNFFLARDLGIIPSVKIRPLNYRVIG